MASVWPPSLPPQVSPTGSSASSAHLQFRNPAVPHSSRPTIYSDALSLPGSENVHDPTHSGPAAFPGGFYRSPLAAIQPGSEVAIPPATTHHLSCENCALL